MTCPLYGNSTHPTPRTLVGAVHILLFPRTARNGWSSASSLGSVWRGFNRLGSAWPLAVSKNRDRGRRPAGLVVCRHIVPRPIFSLGPTHPHLSLSLRGAAATKQSS